MVINVRNLIGRTSCECLANVARMWRECRETFANDSCDNRTTFVRCRKYVLITLSVRPQCDYGCNVAFLSPKPVSN